MIIDETDARRLLYVASEELRARRRGKPPGEQRWLAELVRRLELEVAVSRSGTRSEADEADSDPEAGELITARQASVLLGLSKRQTTNLANDLDGRNIDGRWLFRTSAVLAYREGRLHGHIARGRTGAA